jgi:hypothetical protein
MPLKLLLELFYWKCNISQTSNHRYLLLAMSTATAQPISGEKPEKREKLVATVEKPIPLEFDMGHLTAFDANPLDPKTYRTDREACLSAAIRDGAQALINQVLTALPLKSTAEGIFAELPEPVTPLPREKRIPMPKEPTKWLALFTFRLSRSDR